MPEPQPENTVENITEKGIDLINDGFENLSENTVNIIEGGTNIVKSGISVLGKALPPELPTVISTCFLHVRLVTAGNVLGKVVDKVHKKQEHPFSKEQFPIAMYILYSSARYKSNGTELEFGKELGRWKGSWQDEKDEKERWKDKNSPLHGWWKMTFVKDAKKWDLTREGMGGRKTLDDRKTPGKGKVSLHADNKNPKDEHFLSIDTKHTWKEDDGTKKAKVTYGDEKGYHYLSGEDEGVLYSIETKKSFTEVLANILKHKNKKQFEVLVEKPLLWYPEASEGYNQKNFEDGCIADSDKKPKEMSKRRFPNQAKMEGGYRYGYPQGAIVHYTGGRRYSDRYGPKRSERGLSGAQLHAKKNGFCYFVIDLHGNVSQTFPLNRWGDHCGKSEWDDLRTELSGAKETARISKLIVGIEVMGVGLLKKRDLKDEHRIKNEGTDTVKNKGEVWSAYFLEEIPEKEIRIVKKGALTDAEKKSETIEYVQKKENDNLTLGAYEKYTEKQETSLKKLLIWLYKNNSVGLSIDYVLGHDEVSPGRKQDPGGSLSKSMPDYRAHLKSLLGIKTAEEIEKATEEIEKAAEKKRNEKEKNEEVNQKEANGGVKKITVK